MHEIEELLAAWHGVDRSSSALATLVAVQGSAYRGCGARLLIAEKGPVAGSISAGCLENDLWERCQNLEKPQLVRYDHRGEDDLLWGMGLGCRGLIDVLLEPTTSLGVELTFQRLHEVLESGQSRYLLTFYCGARLGQRSFEPIAFKAEEALEEMILAPPALCVVGSGGDAIALARTARMVGFQVRLVSPQRRPAGLPEDCSWSPWDQGLQLREGEAVVLISHNYRLDLQALRQARHSPAAYIGCLGSRKRHAEMLDELGWEGDDRLHGPVGLDLAASGPREIALAVTSEVLARLRGRSAQSLSRLRSVADFDARV